MGDSTMHTPQYRQFLRDAQDADQSIDNGAKAYAAQAVHTWLIKMLHGDDAAKRPEPLNPQG
jgi:hypothetical protein